MKYLLVLFGLVAGYVAGSLRDFAVLRYTQGDCELGKNVRGAHYAAVDPKIADSKSAESVIEYRENLREICFRKKRSADVSITRPVCVWSSGAEKLTITGGMFEIQPPGWPPD